MWTNKIYACLMISLLAAAFGASIAHAVPGWEASMTATISTAENKLVFGQRADARDGLDARLDVPAMLGGDIQAYFAEGSDTLWRDIKGFHGGTKSWDVRITSAIKNKPVVLRWKPEELRDAGTVTIKDTSTGTIVNMKEASTYSYINTTGTRDFTIEAAE
ncbi:MAG: hypothetical protein HY894_06120 [Deltaproteobacteria bacterium]|nr:hypothetical protein [Deltaproteobacteria bacterium]